MQVVLANYTLSMMRGGGETRDLALARELERLGVGVELLSVKPLGGKIRHPVQGQACRYLPSPYFRDLVYQLMQLPKCGRLASFLLRQDVLQFSRRVVDLLARPTESPDLLQAAGLYPVVELKRRRAIPVVIRNQGGLPPAHLRRYVPLADAVIGDGWDAANFQQRLGRELVEVPGGVDLELFRRVPSELRSRLGLDGAEVVLYVGRFAPLKNVALLIEAFARLRQTRPRAPPTAGGRRRPRRPAAGGGRPARRRRRHGVRSAPSRCRHCQRTTPRPTSSRCRPASTTRPTCCSRRWPASYRWWRPGSAGCRAT